NLVRLEADDRAVAPDDLVVRESILRRHSFFFREVAGAERGLGKDVGREAHVFSYVSVFLGISGIYPPVCEQLVLRPIHNILWAQRAMDTKSSKGNGATQAAFFRRFFR